MDDADKYIGQTQKMNNLWDRQGYLEIVKYLIEKKLKLQLAFSYQMSNSQKF